MYKEPFATGDNLNCDLRFDAGVFATTAPEGDLDWRRYDADFVRLPLDNPWDLTTRSFVAHLAKCYVPETRNLTLMTANLLCAMSDKKVDMSSALKLNTAPLLMLCPFLSLLRLSAH